MEITRPTKDDLIEIENLFSETIENTFKHEKINLSHAADIEPEIKNNIRFLEIDFNSCGKDEYFLIAKIENKIVGTIAFGSVNEIIRSNLDIGLINIPEIKSAYILPNYQSLGVGSKLFKEILKKLCVNKIENFCLDCGYKSSQGFWIQKIGEPTVVLEHYFGKDAHHMIWKCDIN